MGILPADIPGNLLAFTPENYPTPPADSQTGWQNFLSSQEKWKRKSEFEKNSQLAFPPLSALIFNLGGLEIENIFFGPKWTLSSLSSSTKGFLESLQVFIVHNS